MQRYNILHRSYYNFSAPVRFGAHQLRLRPREDHELRIESFDLKITPKANLHWSRDVEGNSVASAIFDQQSDQLLVESHAIIQQFNDSPLDFLLAEYCVDYPFSYPSDDRIMLLPYMAYPHPSEKTRLDEWISGCWKSDEKIQTYTLLHRLNRHIFQSMSYNIREQEGVQAAEQTLALGSGSCRDFANLFMQAARCLGLASRFVSGYLHTPPSNDNLGSTHAWAEVYLPGAGWKGFDPTSGELAGTDHFAVAVARQPESVPPISGSFSGIAESTLSVGVWVTRC